MFFGFCCGGTTGSLLLLNIKISLPNLIGNHQTLYSYIFVYVFVSRFEVSLQSFMGLVFLNFEQTLNTLYSHMNGATAERPFPHYTVPSLYLYC